VLCARGRQAEGCSGKGDEPVLTVRALVGGLLVGSLLCCSNTFFGLQTGWVTMGSLQVRSILLSCAAGRPACVAWQQQPVQAAHAQVLVTAVSLRQLQRATRRRDA